MIILLIPNVAYSGGHQVHARMGGVYAKYDGVVSGTVENYNMIDLEYEYLFSNKSSYYFRTSEAFDIEKSIFTYSYFGLGMKYYFSSRGLYFEDIDGADIIISSPKWRYYYGWEIGVAHVVLQTIGEFLQINTSSYDYGATVGTIYNLTNKLGLEFNLTTQFSTGFTSISTGAVVAKGTVGLTYFL